MNLFAKKQTNPTGETDEVKQKNKRAENDSESKETVDDQIKREQNGADISFHAGHAFMT